MISALHLIWMLPLSAMFGFFMAIAFAAGKEEIQEYEKKEEPA